MDEAALTEAVEVIEEAEPFAPMSDWFFRWVVDSLSGPFVLLLLLSGVTSLIAARIIVRRSKGPMAAAALVLIVHVPIVIGVAAGLCGAANALLIAIARSLTPPEASEFAAGISAMLLGPLIGIVMAAPGYAVAAIGAFTRSARDESGLASPDRN